MGVFQPSYITTITASLNHISRKKNNKRLFFSPLPVTGEKKLLKARIHEEINVN